MPDTRAYTLAQLEDQGLTFRAEVRAYVLAGVVLAVTTAQAQGLGDIGYIAGALAMARFVALTFRLDWQGLVKDARHELGDGLGELLDAAIRAGAIEG